MTTATILPIIVTRHAVTRAKARLHATAASVRQDVTEAVLAGRITSDTIEGLHRPPHDALYAFSRDRAYVIQQRPDRCRPHRPVLVVITAIDRCAT